TLRLETLKALAAAGLGGIEAAGPGISNRLGRRSRDWAVALDLVPVAGSDFHMADRPGRWVGAITTPPADLERLRLAKSRPTIPPPGTGASCPWVCHRARAPIRARHR